MFNLLRDQLAMANDEKSRLYSQVQAQTEELVVLRQSMQEGMDGLYQIIVSLEAKVAELQAVLVNKDAYIHKLEVELLNARSASKSANRKRISPITEQRT